MCHAEGVRLELPRPLNDPVNPAAHIGGSLPLGDAIVPEGPARSQLPDFRRREPLVGAVVPLLEVGIGLSHESGQAAGLRGPDQRAGQDLPERGRAELADQQASGFCLLAALGEEGNIGATGVSPVLGPLGGTVSKEHNPARHGP